MSFIIWTLVWWGLWIIEKAINYWGYGGAENYDKVYSLGTRAIEALIMLGLWIYLYHAYIK